MSKINHNRPHLLRLDNYRKWLRDQQNIPMTESFGSLAELNARKHLTRPMADIEQEYILDIMDALSWELDARTQLLATALPMKGLTTQSRKRPDKHAAVSAQKRAEQAIEWSVQRLAYAAYVQQSGGKPSMLAVHTQLFIDYLEQHEDLHFAYEAVTDCWQKAIEHIENMIDANNVS